jgi:NADH dehydrogenase FAD-containing subunit
VAKRDDVEITIISRDNFTLFTPMLDEVHQAISNLPTSAIRFASWFGV